jgi:ubiquinone/menaquinone biosynthesis C-methylase UbiE
MWESDHRRVLDVGGGTGVIAQALKDLFGVERVVSVDVENRYIESLTIETAIFDGLTLPFADRSFDGVVLFNVLHHVPREVRLSLLLECRRVAGTGPIYIKDHLTRGRADDVRLASLDLLGNLPFSGMLRASYLTEADWLDLATRSSHSIEVQVPSYYRSGLSAVLFPNRLEVSMKWRPV